MGNKTTIVEHVEITRDYGLMGHEAIIDHPKYGRLLIQDSFGGMDSLQGGRVSFKFGLLIQLHADDTFQTITGVWNDYMDLGEAVRQGYDNSRPVMAWTGYMIEKLAESAGL